MANYLRNPDRIERLPLGATVVIHGKHSNFTYTKFPQGWVFQHVGGRLSGRPADMPAKTDDEMVDQMRFSRIELLPQR